jgi:hypothetical protein
MQCYLFEAPSYFIFSSEVPELLYYSHIPTMLLTLLVGVTVFFNNPKGTINQLMLAISVTFSTWVTTSLVAWTSIQGDLLAFIWPLFAITTALLAILCIYFVHVFTEGKDAPHWMKIVWLVMLLPVFLFGHTDLSLSGFNLANCDAFDFEGIPYKTYFTLLGFVAMLWSLLQLIKTYRRADKQRQKELLYLGIGVELFLATFIFTTFIVTYLTGLGYFEDSRLEFYGLFGMTFFMAMIGLLITKFKSFNVGIHTANTLVIALLILVASQYTYANSTR